MPLDTSHNSIFFQYPWNYYQDQTGTQNEIREAMLVSDNDYNTFSESNSITVTIGEDDLVNPGGRINKEYTHIFIKCKNVSRINSIESIGVSTIPDILRVSGSVDIHFGGSSVPIYIPGYERDVQLSSIGSTISTGVSLPVFADDSARSNAKNNIFIFSDNSSSLMNYKNNKDEDIRSAVKGDIAQYDGTSIWYYRGNLNSIHDLASIGSTISTGVSLPVFADDSARSNAKNDIFIFSNNSTSSLSRDDDRYQDINRRELVSAIKGDIAQYDGVNWVMSGRITDLSTYKLNEIKTGRTSQHDTVSEYQNFLIDVSSGTDPNKPTPRSADTLTFTFTGSTEMKIYEIMVLNQIFALKANSDLVKIEFSKQDRGGIIQEDFAGNLSKAPAINNTRSKWNINYGIIFQDSESYDFLLSFMENYPNFAFAAEYSRYPDRVFPAVFPDLDVQLPFLSRVKNTSNAFFRISEA